MSGTSTGGTPWIRVAEAGRHVGAHVEVRGWVEHHRSGGRVQFLLLRDGSGTMQCVAGAKDLPAEQWESLGRVTQESSLMVRGTLRSDPRAPGGVEMSVSSVEGVSVAESYPITHK